jgi:hypothetical protein
LNAGPAKGWQTRAIGKILRRFVEGCFALDQYQAAQPVGVGRRRIEHYVVLKNPRGAMNFYRTHDVTVPPTKFPLLKLIQTFARAVNQLNWPQHSWS